MERVNIVHVNNPFDPLIDRRQKHVDWKPGGTIREYIAEFYPLATRDLDVAVSVNGKVIDPADTHTIDTLKIRPGDSICFCLTPHGGGGGGGGGGKDTGRMVAMIAVMVVATMVTAGAASALAANFAWANALGSTAGFAGALGGASMMGSAVAALAGAAVAIGGSYLVNALMPVSTPNTSSSSSASSYSEDSSTYSFDTRANTDEEGKAVPVPYGTVRVTPYLAGKYTDNDNENSTQRLNALYIIADCPVDGISDVEINDNPISNYRNVNTEVRLGGLEQDVLKGFDDTYYDNAVGGSSGVTVFSNGEQAYSPSSDFSDSSWNEFTLPYACEEFAFYFSFPGGLDNEAQVFSIQYRVHGTTDWTDAGTRTFKMDGTDELVMGSRVTDLEEAVYDVRICRTSGSASCSLSKFGYVREDSFSPSQAELETGEEFTITVPKDWNFFNLYFAFDDGLTGENTFQVEYLNVYDEDGDGENDYEWVVAGIATFSGSTSDAVVRKYAISDLASASYKIRVTRLTGSDSAHIDRVGYAWPTPVTTQTASRYCQYIGTGCVFSGGLYYANGSGDLSDVTVKFASEYRLLNDDGEPVGHWISVQNTVTRGTSSSVSWFTKLGYVDEGQYEIRSYFAEQPSQGTRYGTKLNYIYLREGIKDDFTYPGTSLMGLYALGNDQLSGSMPVVTAIVTRSTVSVYNPNTGEWEAKSATNPAWISYDICVNSWYGRGISYSKMIYSEFAAWAEWCDEKGLVCNIYFDSHMNTASALNQIGLMGRGQVIQRGTKFGCIFDAPSEPVHLFNVGNIKADSLEETFLEDSERANVIEVTYWDETANYEATTKRFQRGDLDEIAEEPRVASVQLYGCTKYELAASYATFLLNCNQHLLRVVSFEADVDAIPVTIGDVFWLQHDIQQWGYGGRIVDVYDDRIVLDRVVAADDTWNMLVRYADPNGGTQDRLTSQDEPLSITGTANYPVFEYLLDEDGDPILDESGAAVNFTDGIDSTKTAVVLESMPTPAPQRLDLYTMGPTTKVAKLFRCTGVEKSGELSCKVTGLEYVEGVYDDATEIVVEESSLLTPVAALTASENFVKRNGVWSAIVRLSWGGTAIAWDVYYRQSGTSAWIKSTTVRRAWCDLDGLVAGVSYDFAVTEAGKSPESGSSVTLDFSGSPADPYPVESLAVSFSKGYLVATWDANLQPWVTGYDVYIDGGTEPVATNISTNEYSTNRNLALGTHIISVYSRDAFGNTSDRTALQFNITIPAKPISGYTEVVDNNVLIYWTAPAARGTYPVESYEIRRDGVVVGKKSGTFTTVLEQTGGTFTYEIYAVDTNGQYSNPETVTAIVDAPKDYVLNAEWVMDFSFATGENAIIEADGSVILPVNTTETWAEHFTTNSMTCVQDFVDSGHGAWATPTPASGSVSYEGFDYGQELESSNVTMTLTMPDSSGDVTLTKSLGAKLESTDEFDMEESSSGTWVKRNFRYLKDMISVVSDGTGIVRLSQHGIRLDLKKKYDGGMETITDADTGLTVSFSEDFMDIIKLTASPISSGGSVLSVVLDFDDVADPQGFTAYLYDGNGAKVTGTFSWSAEGV